MLKRLIKPQFLILFPVLVSFLTWMVDWSDQWSIGYVVKESIELSSGIILFSFYLITFIGAIFGFTLGGGVKKLNIYGLVTPEVLLLWTTVLASIGVIASYAEINSNMNIFSIEVGEGNLLRQGLEYSAGIRTLRYASIVSFALSFSFRKKYLFKFLNLVLLLLGAMIASRMSIVIACFLIIHINSNKISISDFTKYCSFFIVSILILNWLRNMNYYFLINGDFSIFLAGLQEIIKYVGTPFQAQFGILNSNIDFSSGSIVEILKGILYFFIPSFLQPSDGAFFLVDMNKLGEYRDFIDIDPNLSTNSIFVEMYSVIGFYCFPYMFFCAIFFSALFRIFNRENIAGKVISGLIGYCFLEVWRVYTFNSGIIIFNIILIFSICIFYNIKNKFYK